MCAGERNHRGQRARWPPASQRLGSNQHRPGEHLYFQGSPHHGPGKGSRQPPPCHGVSTGCSQGCSPFCIPLAMPFRGCPGSWGTGGTCHSRGTGTGTGGSLPAIVCAEALAPPWRSWQRAAPVTVRPPGPLPAAPAAGHGKELCRPWAQVSHQPAAGVSGRGETSWLVFMCFGVLPSPGSGCASRQSPGCCRGGQNRQSTGAEWCGQSHGSPSGRGQEAQSRRMQPPGHTACPTLSFRLLPLTASAVSCARGRHRAMACRALPLPSL